MSTSVNRNVTVNTWGVPESSITHVADEMRQADIDELWASQKVSPIDGLRSSISLSDYACPLILNDKVVGIFGLVKADGVGADGVPWFLGTDEVDENPVAFIKASKKIVEAMQTWCPGLMNYVHAENEKSIRFLKKLGFTVAEEPEPIGVEGQLFYKFEKGVDRCVIQ